MYSFKQKHVHISNSALKETLQNLHLPNDIQNPEDPNDPLPLWNHYFHIERLTTANRRFGCSIKTDGVKCAVSFLKPKPEPPEFNLFRFRYDGGGYVEMDIGEDDVVWGVDPGRSVLVAGVSAGDVRDGDTLNPFAEPGTTITWTNARWQEECGHRFLDQEHARWDAEHEEIATLIRDIPTPKTNSFDEFMVHMRYILQYRNLFVAYYQQRKWRALRWRTWIK